MVIVLSVPVDIGRDDARDAATNELSRPEYQDARPSIFQRAIEWIIERLDHVPAPGGSLGVIVLIALVVVVAIIVRMRVGRAARTHRIATPVFENLRRSARDYRHDAENAAAAADFDSAVRDRFRAVVRALEELGVLDERAGRTADEAARDAGAMMPQLRSELAAAAAVFDDVHYGNHRADAAAYAAMSELDTRIAGISAK